MLIGESWQFQANDNTRGGWLVFLLYVIVATLSWREVASRFRTTVAMRKRAAGPVLSRQFWIALSLFVSVLGINKQLDLQTLLIEWGRDVASLEGIIEYRRWIGYGFVAVSACVGVFVAAYLWKLFRRATKSERLVLIGTTALAAFAFIRIASINHVEVLGESVDRHRPLIALEIIILLFLSLAIVRKSAKD